MSDTKTYPLSAIMGEETDERGYAQGFADAYNRLCAENADFVAESIKADSRIAELEAEVKTLREDALRYRWMRDVAPKGSGEIADIRSNHSTDEINAAIDAAREGK